jgi:hypothetical protein
MAKPTILMDMRAIYFFVAASRSQDRRRLSFAGHPTFYV